MKAIILAAGTGSRLRPHTENQPKCLVKLKGKPLLEYQIDALKGCGVDDIVLVSGYKSEAFAPYKLKTYHNPQFETTNMVYSLMCAAPEFDEDEDIVVCYGDIVFEPPVIEKLVHEIAPVAVIVDKGWESLWKFRMEDPLADAESMIIDQSGHIIELGRKAKSVADIQGQYIGLFKLSASTLKKITSFYKNLDRQAIYDGKSYKNMFMTSFLQALIDSQVVQIKSVPVNHGWLEVDSVSDLELYEKLLSANELFNFDNQAV